MKTNKLKEIKEKIIKDLELSGCPTCGGIKNVVNDYYAEAVNQIQIETAKAVIDEVEKVFGTTGWNNTPRTALEEKLNEIRKEYTE